MNSINGKKIILNQLSKHTISLNEFLLETLCFDIINNQKKHHFMITNRFFVYYNYQNVLFFYV